MIKWFICLIILGAAAFCDGESMSEDELYMLQDLRQEAVKQRGLYGLSKQLKKPRCFLDDFTASCCLQMQYRTRVGKDLFEPKFHKACFEVGLNLTQLRVHARAYYDTILLNNGSTTTHELIHIGSYVGKFCWGLPSPVHALDMCVWVYHQDIKLSVPSAEVCMAFVITKALKVQFDCIKWDKGEFSLHNEIPMPKEFISLITVRAGANGFKFKVKNKWARKAFKLIKDLWDKVKKLFYKSKDHEKFLSTPAKN